jgi:hypothetical protein
VIVHHYEASANLHCQCSPTIDLIIDRMISLGHETMVDRSPCYSVIWLELHLPTLSNALSNANHSVTKGCTLWKQCIMFLSKSGTQVGGASVTRYILRSKLFRGHLPADIGIYPTLRPQSLSLCTEDSTMMSQLLYESQ